MSYIEDVNIQEQDTGNIDAFGRKRVSQVTTQFDMKQIHDNLPLFVDTVTNGTATSTHSTTEAHSALTTTSNGDWVKSQTKQKFNYQSGKSQLIFLTCNNFGSDGDGVTKRIGYFSSSTTTPFTADLDGLFIQSDNSGVSINAYKTGTLISQVYQSSWNIDKLDGTGKSGITVDWDKNIIFIIDFEWLGVGRVRFGCVIDGLIYYFHNSNAANNITGVYMSSPNHSLRWELIQTGSIAGTFNFICGSVNSEGGLNKLGKILSSNVGTNFINANNTSTVYALIGIRLQSAKSDTLIDLLDFSVLSATNDNQLIEAWLNPTIAGTFTYSNVTNSSVQVALGATNGSNTVTNGTRLFSKYIAAKSAPSMSIENAIRLGCSMAGVLDTIVLTTRPLTSNSDVYGGISWRELA